MCKGPGAEMGCQRDSIKMGQVHVESENRVRKRVTKYAYTLIIMFRSTEKKTVK